MTITFTLPSNIEFCLDEGSVEEAMFGSDKWHTDPDAGLVIDKHLLPQLIAALQGAL